MYIRFLILLFASAVAAAEIPPAPPGYADEKAIFGAVQKGEVKLISPPKAAPESVAVEKDVEYGKVGERALLLDIYRPVNQEKARPCVVIIHGGAWAGGDKAQREYLAYAIPFAEAGYVAASVGYRLSGEAKYPAAVQDAMCAVRFLRANAEHLKIDPDKIAVMGWSAGAHLAMMIGYASNNGAIAKTGGWEDASSAVTFVVNLYGPTDLSTDFGVNHPAVKSFMPETFDANPELYKQASPLHHLDAADPPTLTLHGTIDSVVEIEQGDLLDARMKELGIRHQYDRVEGWSHVFDMEQRLHDRTKALMFSWLGEYLPIEP